MGSRVLAGFGPQWLDLKSAVAGFEKPHYSTGSETLERTMDQQTNTDLDQTDEDILSYTVSDESLEAAGGAERGAWLAPSAYTRLPGIGCCGV